MFDYAPLFKLSQILGTLLIKREISANNVFIGPLVAYNKALHLLLCA